MDARDDCAVKLFQDLVRIPSTSHLGASSGSYNACVALLETACKERGFETRIVSMAENKPILIATKTGSDPSLPSLLLNSHYDVVPADEALWTLAKPFSADIVDNNIVGRGTQDMKSVCIQHLEALHRATSASALLRTVHITFVPDEEIGGGDGLGKFVENGFLKELNVGCALDEGLANPLPNTNTVFYGERAIFWIRIKAKGNVGHGSRFVKDTAVPKIITAVNRFLEFREKQELKFEGHGCEHGVAHKLGDLITLNCTMLNAGVTSDYGETYALNVIPSTAEAGFDIRIPPSVSPDEMERIIHSFIDPESLDIEFVEKVTLLQEFQIKSNPSNLKVFFLSFFLSFFC